MQRVIDFSNEETKIQCQSKDNKKTRTKLAEYSWATPNDQGHMPPFVYSYRLCGRMRD